MAAKGGSMVNIKEVRIMKLDSRVMEKVLLVVGGIAVGYAFREEISNALDEQANVELGPVVRKVIDANINPS
jgi:hypothetical protein